MSRVVMLSLGLLSMLACALPARADPRRVRVLDASGKPVSGAQLLRAGPPTEAGKPVRFDPEATLGVRADAQGWIPIPVSAPEDLIVHAVGLAPARVPVTEPAVTVRLLPARSIQGRVRVATPSPDPVPLHVYALPTGAGDVAHRVVAEGDGTYRFAALHDGIWMLAVRRPPAGRLISLGRIQAGTSAGERQVDLDRPVAGVLLDGDRSETTVAGLTVVLRSVPPGRQTTAVSDANGRFALHALPPGLYEAALESEAWAFEVEPPRVVVGIGEPPAEVAWYVVRCPQLSGRVVDDDKQPVVDASVRLIPALDDRRRGEQEAKTNAQGAYTFDHVPPGDGYRIVVNAAGFSPFVSDPFGVLRVSGAVADLVRLERGWLLEVAVVDLAGKPIPDVALRVAPARRPSGAAGRWQALVKTTTTDANGEARVPDLPPDDALVSLTAASRLARTLRAELPRTEDRARYEVVMQPAAVLRGLVGSSPSDPGPFRIEVRSRDGRETHRGQTDETGAFEITGLRPTAYDLDVRRVADGLLLARVEHVLPEIDDVLEIPLPPRQRVEGRVFGLEEGGAPARVVLEAPYLDRELERYVWIPERTAPVQALGREGRFALDDLRPGAYSIRVVQGGRASPHLQVLVEDVPIEGLDLRIEDGARLAGYVFGEDSKPRVAARVTAEPLRGDGAMRAPLSAARERYTDDDGLFAFEGLAPGLWRVTVREEHMAPVRRTLRLTAGESVVLDDLLLRPGRTLAGRVTDTLDGPLEGLRVVVRRMDGSGRPHADFTGQDGTYRIDDLAQGLYLVRLEGIDPLYVVADQAAVEIADRDVTLDFVPGEGAKLDALVTRAGKPVAGAVVELIAVPDLAHGVIARRQRVSTDVDGRAHFQALNPGRYHLALEVGALRTERTLDIEEHDDLSVDLEAFEGRLRGRVFGPGGRPLAGARVEARSRVDPELVAETFANGEGHFVLNGIPIAAYDVLVSAAGLPPTRLQGAQAELAGAGFPYDIELGTGGNLTVTVVDEADVPVVGAQVSVESDDGVTLHRWPFAANQHGEAHARGLPPGLVRVRVHAHGYASSEPFLLSIPDGATTERRVVLGAPGSLRVIVRGTALDPVPRVRIDVVHSGSREVAAYRRPLRRLATSEAGVHMPRAGSVTLPDLSPGAYEVRIDAGERYVSVARPAQVVVGRTTTVDVALEPK